MIPLSEEIGSQISARLLEVIAHAEFEVLPGLYAFGPLTEGVTPRKDALACVRDGGAWSQLVPVDDGATPTAFRIFSFHFDPGFDATGFVGWLHSHLVRSTDTGHIVVCRLWPLDARRHRSRARRHLRLLGMPGAGGRSRHRRGACADRAWPAPPAPPIKHPNRFYSRTKDEYRSNIYAIISTTE